MFINNSFFFFFLGVIFNWDPYIIWEQEVGVAQGALDKVLYRDRDLPHVSTGYI